MENFDFNEHLKSSSSIDSFVSADQVLNPQLISNFDSNKSLDNIVLESNNLEEKRSNNDDEILNKSEDIISELDLILPENSPYPLNSEYSLHDDLSSKYEDNSLKEVSNIVPVSNSLSDNNDNNKFTEINKNEKTFTTIPQNLTDEIEENSSTLIAEMGPNTINLSPKTIVDRKSLDMIDVNFFNFNMINSSKFGFEETAIVLQQDYSELRDNNTIPISKDNIENSVNNQVLFKEEKGSGILKTDSSANLGRFFADPNAFGSDYDGRKFFDSFNSQNSPNEGHPEDNAQKTELQSDKTFHLDESLDIKMGPEVEEVIYQTDNIGHSNLQIPNMDLKGNNITTDFFQQELEQINDVIPQLNSIHLENIENTVQHVDDLKDIDQKINDKSTFSDEIKCEDTNNAFNTTTPFIETQNEAIVMQEQEPIESSFSSAESMYEAWIPSDATRQILYQTLMAPLGLPQPPANLAMPGIIIEESLGDPIYDLIKLHLGEQEARKRLVLTADSVPQDIIGLQQLIKSDCLRAAVDLTGRLLNVAGQGVGRANQISKHSPHTLQLWFCRFTLLSRLQLFAPAEYEWEAFKNLDTPDLYFEFHQQHYPGRRGSMVPFKMRLLHAEFPQRVGKHQESVDRLCYMCAVIQQILKNVENGLAEDGSSLEIESNFSQASKGLWMQREIEVLFSLVNCYISMKDYLATIDIYKILITKCPTEKDKLYSAMARIFLQVGDIEYATKYYKASDDACSLKSINKDIEKLMHQGMLEMGNGRFEEAYTIFKQASEKDSNNILAINNMSVCALYVGKLKEALQIYENLIALDPSKYLIESIILNLCTLYELESSKSNLKKLNLLRLIGQYKGTGFNIACLKMS